jgi:outer membrane protein insertion porin family
MRSERAALVLALLLARSPLAAQDALTGVGPKTQVKSIEFRFTGGQTLLERDLRPHIALTERGGAVGLRRIFGWVPLVPSVGNHPFKPIELQRDVARLRNLYILSGFLKAKVDYDVHYDAKEDLVDVAFLIEEGPPVQLRDIRFVARDSSPPAIDPDLKEEWDQFVRAEREVGGRFGEGERRGLAERTSRWLRNRGYPFGAAEAYALVDTAAYRTDVVVRVQPGLRAKVREFAVTGNKTVPAKDLTRQLPIEAGDWYDAAELEEGRARLAQFPIVRLASLNVPRGSADDSSVVVRVGMTENPPQQVSGEAGLISNGGLSGEVDWMHRSFMHGLRTFTVSATAQTGLLALETPAEQRYRLALTFFQPYVGTRRLSAAGGPFVEYRDDLRDRSQAIGFEGTLVYATSPLRSISLGYSLSHREVFDFGFSDDLDPIEFLPLLGLEDSAAVGSLGTIFNRSTLTLDGSWGKLDAFANPRRGYVLRPRASVTLPGFNTSEYLLLDFGATGFYPLTERIGFTLRSSVGRIFPYGRSVDDALDESAFVSLLRLRDVTFSAGGSRDVRGWGSQLVGPKLPEVRVRQEAGQDVYFAERYTPVGGLSRLHASAEVQMPLPGFGDKWQTFAFLDGARIWTSDERFDPNAGELGEDRFFMGTGVGIGYETVVGAVEVALGYKLNPSALDVRDPDDVLQALRAGEPIDSKPTDSMRRFQLHFSIGATF